MQTVLELRDLSKHFTDHKALDGISLEIPRGSFYSLLGPSGCGKTTTLRLVAGFEQPTGGEVRLNGQSINHLRPYQRNVSTVFQNYALFPHLTVEENIRFGLKRRDVADMDRRAREAIAMVQLAGKEKRYPSEISGGERQRVALARSLVLEPEVLLLDEPLAALDPALRKQMRGELKELQRRIGITFLFVTHDQEEALTLSDKIAVMRQGRIEQTGTPEEIYLRPRNRFVAGFLGAVNWVDGAGIRPEATRLTRAAPPAGARACPATIAGCVFLGNSLQVEARLPSGASVIAEVPRPDGGFDTGENVQVWWRASDEMRFPQEPA
ncbi:MAG TPA: ABC transporter ATP-binding protein [Bryobacteraceae bacterium]|nr:ABC transporter ATP-binding protein [Bryobacteraceae bacterium]